MSEGLYRWLLRLFPSDFRERFGEEAIQLLRDRLREEKGVRRRFRLWADLIFDLAVSLPIEHLRLQPKFAEVAHSGAYRGPAFQVLDGGSPRGGAWLLGGMISVLALAGLSAALAQVIRHPAAAPVILQQGFNSQASLPPQTTQDVQAERWSLDAAERARIVGAIARDLREHYVDRQIGEQIAESLVRQERNGGYDGISDPSAFADLLTNEMRSMSHDMELGVLYTERDLPVPSGGPTARQVASYREAMEQSNCTFEKVEILADNIGYFKLNSFPELSVCRAEAISAMAKLNRANAIVFDLRDNRGGYPEMTAFIASYLFDRPEYWYNPRENTSQRSWTPSPVHGNLLADKPVYILTSPVTASGAEQFTYDLKMLKRGTIVGEHTAGAAHAGAFFRIDDHFGVGIPEVRPINPFSKNDWAVVGIDPDVKVNTANALNTAELLAQAQFAGK